MQPRESVEDMPGMHEDRHGSRVPDFRFLPACRRQRGVRDGSSCQLPPGMVSLERPNLFRLAHFFVRRSALY